MVFSSYTKRFKEWGYLENRNNLNESGESTAYHSHLISTLLMKLGGNMGFLSDSLADPLSSLKY